jgi:flagellar assembly factor FliW
MKVPTTRFGEISVREEDVLRFPRGLIGFPDMTRYAIVDHPGDGPFQWLQSLDRPDVAFVITDPLLFFPDYTVPVTPEELGEIGIGSPEEGVVVVILVVPRDPYGITANLQGPLVINARDRLAMQLVLSVPEYTTKHLIFAKEEVPQGT